MGVGLVCTSNHCCIHLKYRFHSAVVTCTNRDNSHFLSPLDNQPEIHCRPCSSFVSTNRRRKSYFSCLKNVAPLSLNIFLRLCSGLGYN